MKPFAVMRRAYKSGGGGGGSYLDGLATLPRAALGLKKLISTATVAVRVRRSSDNAEQDIGFSGDALDTSALATFVGANSGYVVTIYDQTGNGEDATQATASKQARIVNAGVYDGTITFDGTDDAYKITSLALSNAALNIFGSISRANVSALQIMVEGSANWNSNTYAFIYYFNNASGAYEGGMNSAVAGTQRTNQFVSMNLATTTKVGLLYNRAITGSGEVAARQNGTALGINTVVVNEMTGTFVAQDVYIGGRGAASLFAGLRLNTLVFYDADVSSIASSIEALL